MEMAALMALILIVCVGWLTVRALNLLLGPRRSRVSLSDAIRAHRQERELRRIREALERLQCPAERREVSHADPALAERLEALHEAETAASSDDRDRPKLPRLAEQRIIWAIMIALVLVAFLPWGSSLHSIFEPTLDVPSAPTDLDWEGPLPQRPWAPTPKDEKDVLAEKEREAQIDRELLRDASQPIGFEVNAARICMDKAPASFREGSTLTRGCRRSVEALRGEAANLEKILNAMMPSGDLARPGGNIETKLLLDAMEAIRLARQLADEIDNDLPIESGKRS